MLPNPTEQWLVKQLREDVPFYTTPKYLIFYRELNFGAKVVAVVRSFGMKPVRTSFRKAKAICSSVNRFFFICHSFPHRPIMLAY